MKITLSRRDAFVVLQVEGAVVRDNQAELRGTIEELVSNGTKGIALDLAKVSYMDSAGLGCCSAVHKLLRDKGSGAFVVFGAPPNIEKTWNMIRLDLVVPLLEDEEEALAVLTADCGGQP